MLRLSSSCLLLVLAAQAQTNPVESQFHRLMGEPQVLVGDLLNFPWRSELPDSLPSFKKAPPGDELRIVSVRRPVTGIRRWVRWESEDGKAWIDVIRFVSPYDASMMLNSAHQGHSGYEWDRQHLLFSLTGDPDKEAVGAALIAPDGSLLNVGLKLPFGVHWDRPLSEADRVAFDAALSTFQATLEMLAHNFLDPTYVTFDNGIALKPDAISLQHMGGFARMWSYVKYNFVYLDERPGLNWDSVLDRYMPLIAAAKDDVEYGRLLQQAMALLHDAHSNVYPNRSAPTDAPAIWLEPVEGKPVATIVGSLPELDGIHPGMELLEIDGTPVETYMERNLDPYISSSTRQDLQVRRMWVLLGGPPDSKVRTRWLTLEGKTIEATLTRNRSKNRGALKFPQHDLFEHKNLPGDIAYIALNSFSDAKIVDRFEAKFDQLRQAKAWIIDVRLNGGGNSGNGDRIIAHFIQSTTLSGKWGTRLYNPSWEAVGDKQSLEEAKSKTLPDKIEPAPGPHFDGPIYVLTSAQTFSAAEDFLVPLKASKRATLVGELTGGSTGEPLPFTVYGASGRVCTKWVTFPDGTEFVGVGILPDVPVARTKADVASGRDAVLEKAIVLASHNSQGQR